MTAAVLHRFDDWLSGDDGLAADGTFPGITANGAFHDLHHRKIKGRAILILT